MSSNSVDSLVSQSGTDKSGQQQASIATRLSCSRHPAIEPITDPARYQSDSLLRMHSNPARSIRWRYRAECTRHTPSKVITCTTTNSTHLGQPPIHLPPPPPPPSSGYPHSADAESFSILCHDSYGTYQIDPSYKPVAHMGSDGRVSS
jgi:hypothetical protein